MSIIGNLIYRIPDPVRRSLMRNRAAWWIRHRLKKTKVTEMEPPLDGFRMELPADYEATYGARPVEKPVADFIVRTVKPGWNIVDAGAFAGYYTLVFSKLVGEHGTVHAFEPIPENNRMVRNNVRLNRRGNVSVNQLAVGASDYQASFRRSRDLYSPYGSLIPKDDSSRYESINVQVRSLDSYMAEQGWPHISMVKVDVEAAEAQIAAGMEETVRRSRPVLVIEIHDRPAHDQERARQVLPILFSWGYRLYCLEDDPDLKRPLQSADQWSGEKHCIAFDGRE